MLLQSIKQGFRNGIDTTIMLGKIIVPVYFVVTFLHHTPVIDFVAQSFEPLMSVFNLPGESAMILVMGNLLSLYSGVGAIQALSLNSFEITLLAMMLNFSHSLFIETAVATRLNVSGTKIMALRVGLMLASGLIFGTLAGGVLQRWM
ncbi:MAG: nucleoside recognition protein [Tindallia sp. MSAO_Bac2]|nr:MAG: nucleoside recognition protein [Tindallia sp. MSAO_Bac2]